MSARHRVCHASISNIIAFSLELSISGFHTFLHGRGAALASILSVAQARGVSCILKPAEAVILKAGLPPFPQRCELAML